jgi:arsenate reductase (thioredoxin)
MAQRALNVLFVCERNSVRSIMAEALLNRFSEGRFRAFSAGIAPAADVHPLAVEMLKESGIAVANLMPKSVREFALPSAPRMDFVISMGKNPAAALRGLPGNPMRVQWGISDTVTGDGDAAAQRFAFRRALRELENRIRLFVLVRHHREAERSIEAERPAQNA